MDISPSRTGLLAQTFWRSPGSRAHCFLTCWGSSTTPSPAAARELTRFAGVAFPLTEKGRHSDCSFRSSMARPPVPLSTLQLSPSRATVQDSRPEWSRFSFSVGLSHPLQCAGLARRSLSPGFSQLVFRHMQNHASNPAPESDKGGDRADQDGQWEAEWRSSVRCCLKEGLVVSI
jgi:hypothetical protein